MFDTLLTQSATLAAVEGEAGLPAWVFGVLAFGALMALLALTWAFRSVGNRHAPPTGHGHVVADGHGPGHPDGPDSSGHAH